MGMKTFVLICRDTKDSKEKRPIVREAHLNYWRPYDEAGLIHLAGPMTDFAGSIFILRAESEEEVRKLAENDPYTKADVFESHEVHPFKCVLPATQFR